MTRTLTRRAMLGQAGLVAASLGLPATDRQGRIAAQADL